jgi:cardiolipin synthase
MDFALLVGAAAFRGQALADMSRARRRLYVQAMTFEADEAGRSIAEGVLQSPASDRRALVDDYSRWVINDRLVYAPHNLPDRALQAEARATREMFASMRRDGVGVRVTNPMGVLLLSGLPFRNHKKLIVADDVAYVGGINFSDHNFSWRDLMLRIEGAAAADLLAGDFLAGWEGRSKSWSADLGPLGLHSFDGRDNAPAFRGLMAAIDGAEREIRVVSPYLTFPFLDSLEAAARRGVRVQLITPLANNKPTVRDYLLWAAARAGFEVRLAAAMIHLKAMLIDGRTLVLGSSNFDFVSYSAEEELMAVVTDAALIGTFQQEVIAPLLADALPQGACPAAGWAGRRSLMLLKAADLLVRTIPYRRRGARDWPG